MSSPPIPDAPIQPGAINSVAAPASASAAPPPPATTRLASIDAYRGLVMFLMLAEVLELAHVAKAVPGSGLWSFLAYHQEHAEWVSTTWSFVALPKQFAQWFGCSLHDLIQPSFSFLVGVALPFSLAKRAALGQPLWARTLHAFWRAAVLVLLGVFLRSWGKATNWTFDDTLAQIGLGYGFLYLIAQLPRRWQWASLGTILVGYWIAFAAYPLPGADFDWKAIGSPTHHLTGFAAHWDIDTNIAAAFDRWFMNLFPRGNRFVSNGGYVTLSFIPTLGTMILGLLAGTVMRSDKPVKEKMTRLLVSAGVGIFLALLLNDLGLCPIVKKVWTPSWVLFSGGWCFLLLAMFYAVVDLAKLRWLAFPLIVIGMNSIVAYLSAWMWRGYIMQALYKHFGRKIFMSAGAPYEPLLIGSAVLLVQWLILFWMYRRKAFLYI